MDIIGENGANGILVRVLGESCFIANTKDKLRYPPKNVYDIMKFGNWDGRLNDKELLKEIMEYEEVK